MHALLSSRDIQQTLQLTLTAYDGIARLHVNEAKDSGKRRFQVPHALQPDVDSKAISWGKQKKSSSSLALQLDDADITLQYSPLQLDVSVNGKPAISFNSKSLFNFEHLREKQVTVPCLQCLSASQVCSLTDACKQLFKFMDRTLLCIIYDCLVLKWSYANEA